MVHQSANVDLLLLELTVICICYIYYMDFSLKYLLSNYLFVNLFFSVSIQVILTGASLSILATALVTEWVLSKCTFELILKNPVNQESRKYLIFFYMNASKE